MECWSGCGGGSRSVTLVPLSVVARTRPSHTPGCMAGWGGKGLLIREVGGGSTQASRDPLPAAQAGNTILVLCFALVLLVCSDNFIIR